MTNFLIPTKKFSTNSIYHHTTIERLRDISIHLYRAKNLIDIGLSQELTTSDIDHSLMEDTYFVYLNHDFKSILKTHIKVIPLQNYLTDSLEEFNLLDTDISITDTFPIRRITDLERILLWYVIFCIQLHLIDCCYDLIINNYIHPINVEAINWHTIIYYKLINKFQIN